MKNLISLILRNYKKRIFLILGIALSIILCFINIGYKNLFLDEVASLSISKDWLTMSKIIWNFEGNMWIYYILLHFWIILGSNENVLRSFSFIWAIFTIFPLFFLTKQLFGNKTANIIMILFPFNVFFVKNAQFVRGYSLLLFLTTLSTLIFINIINNYTNKKLLLYVIINILALYAHLFAVFILGTHLLYLIYRRNKFILKKIISADFIIFLLLLPLLLSPALKSGQINWIQIPSIYSLGATFVLLTQDFLPLSILSILLIFWFLVVKGHEFLHKAEFIFILIWILFPISFAYVFSILVKPIYNLEYFIICLVPVSIFLALILANLKSKNLTLFLVIIFILGSIVRLYFWYGSINTNLKLFTINNKTAEWKYVTKYIVKNSQQNDAIIVTPTYAHISLDYYKQNYKNYAHELLLQPNNLSTGKPSQFNKQLLQYIPQHYSRVWYINETDIVSDNQQQKLITSMLNKNYKQIKRIYFYQINLILYEN